MVKRSDNRRRTVNRNCLPVGLMHAPFTVAPAVSGGVKAASTARLLVLMSTSNTVAAADLPGVRPAADTIVFGFVLVVESVVTRSDQHIGVGAGTVGAPRDLTGVGVHGSEPAANPKTRRHYCRPA